MWQLALGWWVAIWFDKVQVVMTEFRCGWFLGLLVVVGERRYGGWWVLIWLVNDGMVVISIEISWFFFYG